MDVLPMGGNGVDTRQSITYWKQDIEEIIAERAEVFGIP